MLIFLLFFYNYPKIIQLHWQQSAVNFSKIIDIPHILCPVLTKTMQKHFTWEICPSASNRITIWITAIPLFSRKAFSLHPSVVLNYICLSFIKYTPVFTSITSFITACWFSVAIIEPVAKYRFSPYPPLLHGARTIYININKERINSLFSTTLIGK